MQKLKGNTVLIVVVIILAVLLVVAIALGAYFWGKTKSTTPEASPTMTSTVSPTATPTEAVSEPEESPKEVVENFMNYTLGTLPSAKLDFEAARALLTEDQKIQFSDDNTFAARFYGIQDGPTSVKFISENITGDESVVRYDPSWGEMSLAWAFFLVKIDNQWLISDFRNDAQ